MSVATVCLWAANFVVSLTFPVMADRFNESYTFWVYALMCAVTFSFVKMMLPETKGKSLEQIEKDWR